jgi:hypothetical protein
MSIKSFFAPTKSNKRSLEDSESSNASDNVTQDESKPPVKKSLAETKTADVVSKDDNSHTDVGVEQSVSNADSALTSELTDPSWAEMLRPEFEKPYFKRLCLYVEQQYSSRTVFPPRREVFSAFNICPYAVVKVVIIGQDPYHGPGQANGLAFSVARNVAVPPSLRNIYKVAQVSVRGDCG